MVTLPPMPKRIQSLPVDERGYPVPWFVAWVDGVPEFRAADGRKWRIAVNERLCWVCGQKLLSHDVFVIGPMCVVNRTTSEPPCHPECAIFSAMACPFLTKPMAQRREANLPEEASTPAGEMITRNPGVTCLWYGRGFKLFDDGQGRPLIRIPNPSQVKWFREGRRATRAEIMESIGSGIPLLEKIAIEESPDALRFLRTSIEKSMVFVPKA